MTNSFDHDLQLEAERASAYDAGLGDEFDEAHGLGKYASSTTKTTTAVKQVDAATSEESEQSPADLIDLGDYHSYNIPADQISYNAIAELLVRYDVEDKHYPKADFLARQMLAVINSAIQQENNRRLTRKAARLAANGQKTDNVKLGNDEKVYAQSALTPMNIAQILLRTQTVVNIAPTSKLSNPDLDMLAIYDDNKHSITYGTYLVNESAVTVFARELNRQLSINDMKEVMAVLREQAPRRERATNRDLIAVGNGIVDYKTKQLMPFSPEHIFMSKARIKYNPDAQNPICHNEADGTDWNVESWMSELSDDPDTVELLWQVIGATIRPYVSWNKSAWFYSEQGNNGKGSLVELMRQLIGPMAYAAIPLNDFGKDFALEPLTQASAILVDENDVGTFIDKAANLKAIITNDVISINRKHKVPISYQFHGFMVQCLNEFPKIKDKSESFYRRQLFIPFTKCFTGAERKYIKDDYLKRNDVLEYVLWRVINMDDYYDFIETEDTTSVLAEYKEFNDPIRAFWTEMHVEDDNGVIKPAFRWDLLPFSFAYDLYKAWLKEAMPSSTPLGRNTFIKDLIAVAGPQTGKIIDDYKHGRVTLDELRDVWTCPSSRDRHRSSTHITAPEPLIADYRLDDWVNHKVSDQDTMRLLPELKQFYSGLIRGDVAVRQALTDKEINQIESQRHLMSLTPAANAPVGAPTDDTDTDTATTNNTVTSGNDQHAALTPGVTDKPATPVVDTSIPRFAPSPITPRVSVIDHDDAPNTSDAPSTGELAEDSVQQIDETDQSRTAPEAGAGGTESRNHRTHGETLHQTNHTYPTNSEVKATDDDLTAPAAAGTPLTSHADVAAAIDAARRLAESGESGSDSDDDADDADAGTDG